MKDLEEDDPIFDAFSPRDYPLIYIALIRKKNTQTIDRLLKPYGMNTNLWRLFGALHDFGGLHISELSERIAVERTQLSRLIDQTEDQGFIERKISTSDRRQTKLFLTEKGRQAFAEVLPIVIEHYEILCRDLSATEMKILMRGLGKILDNFNPAPD